MVVRKDARLSCRPSEKTAGLYRATTTQGVLRDESGELQVSMHYPNGPESPALPLPSMLTVWLLVALDSSEPQDSTCAEKMLSQILPKRLHPKVDQNQLPHCPPEPSPTLPSDPADGRRGRSTAERLRGLASTFTRQPQRTQVGTEVRPSSHTTPADDPGPMVTTSPPQKITNRSQRSSGNTDASTFSSELAQTATTSTSSVDSIRLYTPLSHKVDCSLAATPSKVTIFKRYATETLFVGLPDQIELPQPVVDKWESDVRNQLMIDLKDVIDGIQKEGTRRRAREAERNITSELRMSGYAPRGSRMVTVEPCIWILCGSRWASAAVREAIKDYTWLSNFIPAKAEVRVGGAVLANTAVPTDLEGLDYSCGLMLGPDSFLYINIEDYSDRASLCGLVCCATVKHGRATMHRISRIGGLIELDLKDDKPLSCGISTAHGVLSNLLDSQESHDDLEDQDSSDDHASESEDGDTGMVVPRIPGTRDSRPGTLDPKMFTKWRNHSLDTSLSFLGQFLVPSDADEVGLGGTAQLVSKIEPNSVIPAQVDHLLTSMAPRQTNNPNRYCVGRGKAEIEITHALDDRELRVVDRVVVLCGQDTVVEGTLVSGSTNLVVHGQTLTLRKIYLGKILANGVSGSWVVWGKAMCGMIVAIFEHEPYALFMTAQHVFSNIKQENSAIREVKISGFKPQMTQLNTAMFTKPQASNTRPNLPPSRSSRITDLLASTHQTAQESSLALTRALFDIQAQHTLFSSWAEVLYETTRLQHCLSGLLRHLIELTKRVAELDPSYLEDQLRKLKQLLRKVNRDIVAFQATARAGKQLPSFRKYWGMKWKRHTEVLEQWPLSLSTPGGPAVVEHTTSQREEKPWLTSLRQAPIDDVMSSGSTIAVSDDGSARLSKPFSTLWA